MANVDLNPVRAGIATTPEQDGTRPPVTSTISIKGITMEYLTQEGDWCFEVKQVQARRVSEYGKPYTGSALLTVTDGVLHVESLILKEGDTFSRKDYKNIIKYASDAKFPKIETRRYKSGVILDKEVYS